MYESEPPHDCSTAVRNADQARTWCGSNTCLEFNVVWIDVAIVGQGGGRGIIHGRGHDKNNSGGGNMMNRRASQRGRVLG
jgi:hypothetical protein